MSKGETQSTNTARELGRASYVTSAIGVVVAVIIVFAVLTAVSRQFCSTLHGSSGGGGF